MEKYTVAVSVPCTVFFTVCAESPEQAIDLVQDLPFDFEESGTIAGAVTYDAYVEEEE